MSVATEEPVREPWVFLLGRPPIQEYLSFMVQASPGQNVDLQGLAEQWRAAAVVVDELTLSEAGIANDRSATPLPDELSERAVQYMADPAVRATYAFLPARIAMVALDEIVVFQKQINLRYVQELRALICDSGLVDERLFNFCMAIGQPEPAINRGQTTQNGFTFQSISTDLRFLGAALLDASQVTGYTGLM